MTERERMSDERLVKLKDEWERHPILSEAFREIDALKAEVREKDEEIEALAAARADDLDKLVTEERNVEKLREVMLEAIRLGPTERARALLLNALCEIGNE